MTYRSRLVGVCLLFLLITMTAAAFVYWSAGELHYYFERSRLAHQVLEGHLQLKAYTYKLFKQRMDSLLASGTGNEFDESEVMSTLLADLNRLRALIAAEVSTERDEDLKADEIGELETLAALERQVFVIIAEFDEMRRLAEQDRGEEARQLLERTLEQTIDEGFSTLMRRAIDEEEIEVEAIDAAAGRMMATIRGLAAFLVAAAVIVTAGALFMLLTRLERPARALSAGTARLAAGDLSHRVRIDGHDEFTLIATNINSMADELQRHRDTLLAGKVTLERQVAERTAELQHANSALQAADATRRRLFADISHELRTPLTVIRGEAEITLRGQEKPVEDYAAALKRIIEQADHTAALVDDLLFIARSDAGDTRMATQAVAWVELVSRACAEAAPLAANKGCTLDFRTTVEDATITGDPNRLRQAVMILLDNAIRYSPANSAITVAVFPATGGVGVRVSDNGIGIAEDDLARVFERFYRGGGADHQHGSGAGLGLPIAKAIVEAHGGTIALTSRFGEGTEASITLPVSHRLRIVA